MSISLAPQSTHVSQCEKAEDSDVKSSTSADLLQSQFTNTNLLQVTVENRAIIFNLQKIFKDKSNVDAKDSSNLVGRLAVRDIDGMQQMMDPERFVCSDFNMQKCYQEFKEGTPDGYNFTESIVPNKAKTFFFLQRQWNKF